MKFYWNPGTQCNPKVYRNGIHTIEPLASNIATSLMNRFPAKYLLTELNTRLPDQLDYITEAGINVMDAVLIAGIVFTSGEKCPAYMLKTFYGEHALLLAYRPTEPIDPLYPSSGITTNFMKIMSIFRYYYGYIIPTNDPRAIIPTFNTAKALEENPKFSKSIVPACLSLIRQTVVAKT